MQGFLVLVGLILLWDYRQPALEYDAVIAEIVFSDKLGCRDCIVVDIRIEDLDLCHAEAGLWVEASRLDVNLAKQRTIGYRPCHSRFNPRTVDTQPERVEMFLQLGLEIRRTSKATGNENGLRLGCPLRLDAALDALDYRLEEALNLLAKRSISFVVTNRILSKTYPLMLTCQVGTLGFPSPAMTI